DKHMIFNVGSRDINYRESLDYEMFNRKAVFYFAISRGGGLYNFYDTIQIHPSCDKIKISKKSLSTFSIWQVKPTGEIFYQILKADNPNRFSSVKMCSLSIASEMNRVQDCN
ncbi:MAG: hypothetical protein ACR2M7_04455, partial [Bdellovibrionales bacterium]